MEQQVSNIRKGKTILVKWQVSADFPLPKESLTLEMLTPNGGTRVIPNKNWTFEGNTVEYTHEGVEQCALGKYGYTLWLNKGQWGQTCVDKTLAYNLVAKTEQETSIYVDHLELVTIELVSTTFNVTPTLGGVIPDAPKDGEIYGRKNGDWVKTSQGSVRAIEVADFPSGEFVCEGAFEYTLMGSQASHHRMIDKTLRVDCFAHPMFLWEQKTYLITTKQGVGNYTMLGALVYNGGYALRSLNSEILPTILGGDVEFWKNTILPLFGEDLPEKIGEVESSMEEVDAKVDGFAEDINAMKARIKYFEDKEARETQKWNGVNLDEVIGSDEGANGEFYIYNRGNNSFMYEDQQNNHTWKRPTLFKCTIEYNSGVKEIRLRSSMSQNCWYVGDPSTSVGIPLPYFDNTTSRTRRSVLEVGDGDIESSLCKGMSYRFTKTNRNGNNKRWLEAQYIGTNDISTGQSESEYNEWLFITPEQYEDKRGRY